jgi:hypothetical protein
MKLELYVKSKIVGYGISSRDSAVGIATGYGLDDRGFESR